MLICLTDINAVLNPINARPPSKNFSTVMHLILTTAHGPDDLNGKSPFTKHLSQGRHQAHPCDMPSSPVPVPRAWLPLCCFCCLLSACGVQGLLLWASRGDLVIPLHPCMLGHNHVAAADV